MVPRRLDDGLAARERAASTALRGCRIDRAAQRVRTFATSPARTFVHDRGDRDAYE